MATDWKVIVDLYSSKIDGYFDRTGKLKSVEVKTLAYTVRHHDEEPSTSNLWDYLEEENVYEEWGNTFEGKFTYHVDDGIATLSSFKPLSSEHISPEFMSLLRASEALAENVDGVDEVESPIDAILEHYTNAQNMEFEGSQSENLTLQEFRND